MGALARWGSPVFSARTFGPASATMSWWFLVSACNNSSSGSAKRTLVQITDEFWSIVECALVVLDRFRSSLQCEPNSGQPFVSAGRSLTPVPSSLDRINQEGINDQRVILSTLFVRLRDISTRQEANRCGASPGRGTADRSDVRFDEPSPGGTEDPDLRTRCSSLPCSNRACRGDGPLQFRK